MDSFEQKQKEKNMEARAIDFEINACLFSKYDACVFVYN